MSSTRKRTNLIKTMLKTSFPETRFTVKTDRGSTSESIDVSWTDGPTVEQVEEQTKLRHHFEDVSRCEITQEILLGGNTYFFYNRTYSDASIELCKNAVRQFMRSHPSDAEKGQWWIDQWVQENAWRIFQVTDFRKIDPGTAKVYGLTHHGSETYIQFTAPVSGIPEGATHVMVGHIKPFTPVFRARAKALYILERSPRREEGVLPDTACERLVPEADVVVITGSALANGTLDRLLELAMDAGTVAIVGPTASCLPDPLFDRGVDYVGGIRIRDADRAMQILSEGGGTPQLRRAGGFVTFKAG